MKNKKLKAYQVSYRRQLIQLAKLYGVVEIKNYLKNEHKNENKKVEDIAFEGHGCAISMASASIMTDMVRGKEEKEVKEIVTDFLGMIKENPDKSWDWPGISCNPNITMEMIKEIVGQLSILNILYLWSYLIPMFMQKAA